MTSPIAHEPVKRQWMSRDYAKIALLIIVSVLSLGALIFPIAIRQSQLSLQPGDVSPQDIQTSREITYASDILTEQARLDAERSVESVYLTADPTITRRQIENLRIALQYFEVVRQDSHASLLQKITDINAVNGLQLDRSTIEQILELPEASWQTIQPEAISVLEETMRNTIREDQVEDAQRRIPTLISFSLNEDQASIVSALVSSYVTANSLYSEELTLAAQQAARDAVEPVTKTFAAGEIIVRRGQIITAANWEALEKAGFIRSENKAQDFLAAFGLVAVLACFLMFYFKQRTVPLLNDFRSLLLVSVIFLFFLYCAKFVIPNRTVIPYLFPLAAFGLTVASLYSLETGITFTVVLSVLTAYGMSNALDLTLYYTLSTFCGILILGKGRHIGSFFWAGIAIGLSGTAVVFAYRLPDALTDWVGLATLSGAAFFSGLASASLTLLFQFLFSQALGVTTALQLLDFSRPDHPLLQFILHNAPGTYQHSLQVSNLAEQAAEAIGADAMLTRVGGMYHDAGKAANPLFFIENQVKGKLDTHDDLDPAISAATIIRHVTDGVSLARKYHLPARLQDFMREHHGTLITRYQYARALELVNQDRTLVDDKIFRYPGPRPRSKETALLMLADSCEARARAEIPKDETELRLLVKKVIDFAQREGQLDDTNLTMKDLSVIADTFINSLRNQYHPRIQYPEIEHRTAPLTEFMPTISQIEEKKP
jgi:putative nucleotidyltransferase with HDIG domain